MMKDGSVSYRGAIYYQSASAPWLRFGLYVALG